MGRLSLLHGVPSRYIHVHVYIYTVYELSRNLFRTVVFKLYIQQFSRELPTAHRVYRVKCVKWFHYECKMLFFCNSPELLKAQPSFPDFPLIVCRCSCRFFMVFFLFSFFLPYPSVSFNQTYLGWKGIHFCLRKGLRPFRGGDDSGILKMNGFQKSSPESRAVVHSQLNLAQSILRR